MVVVLHKARELYIIKKTGMREVMGLFRVVVEAHGTTRQTFAKHVTACGLALGLRMTGTAAALIRHNSSLFRTFTPLNVDISTVYRAERTQSLLLQDRKFSWSYIPSYGRCALVTKRRRSRVSVDFCYSLCLYVGEVTRTSNYSKVPTNAILPSKVRGLEERTSTYLDVPASNRM
jgi:hypothetical protein